MMIGVMKNLAEPVFALDGYHTDPCQINKIFHDYYNSKFKISQKRNYLGVPPVYGRPPIRMTYFVTIYY